MCSARRMYTHLQLKNTLESAKAAQAEAGAKTKTPAKKDTVEPSAGKPKEDAKPAAPAKPPTPKTASLFDMPAPAPPATPPVAGTTPERDEEVELLDELEEKEDGRPADEYDEAA